MSLPPAEIPGPGPDGAALSSPDLYINRELSLLEFQARVLEEAADPDNPLLERVKFLAILGSNLDEFFMVRVAGLMKQVASGTADVGRDGRTATCNSNSSARKFGRSPRKHMTFGERKFSRAWIARGSVLSIRFPWRVTNEPPSMPTFASTFFLC